ncbi:unnamed protein product [Rotaria sp. Silwood1]|nr:unnamed protein product [Rotaria sp. Silwood1]CAF4642899.1 unnamed protein product [Rotaria sp. Silwood1]CAF4745007.1 unnamed protein product [Rotaria sp. Silwood1]CAF4803107.1 unnamed protein product [Rotaria sp. Silwood1]CAF4811941.1 unnamed protein product [Rotaria sp. Silwood1]
MNEKTSVRIQQWVRSSTFLQSIKTNHKIIKQVKHYQQIESSISNNSSNIIESQQNRFQPIQDQIIKHLNGWHCLQILYHRSCYYTLGMNLCQVIRSFMSNSQEMLILSIYIEPFLKQQFTNKIESENTNLFASIPTLIRRYGIHAILNFKSQVELYNHVQRTLEENRIFRDIMNYPLQKTLLVYDIIKKKKKTN